MKLNNICMWLLPFYINFTKDVKCMYNWMIVAVRPSEYTAVESN
jgi:hypothetical protein